MPSSIYDITIFNDGFNVLYISLETYGTSVLTIVSDSFRELGLVSSRSSQLTHCLPFGVIRDSSDLNHNYLKKHSNRPTKHNLFLEHMARFYV